MITNESSFTEEECFKNAMTYYYKRLPFYIIVTSLGFIAALVGGIILFTTQEINAGYFLGAGIVFFIVGAFMLIALPLRIKKGNRVFKNGVKYLYTFDDEKLTIACKMSNTVTKNIHSYNQFIKKEITKDNLLRIYIPNNQFYLLRLDQFKSEEDKKKVFEYLKMEEN